ncbi:meiosis initiator protein [Varanus komodoensis]|uniref:meiosis initiator protein n=1 Tax=Varanus komodoensis TaxID=61221 RepID=UPI001CF7BB08|nr:meiosis initiator protein [Varanus komodoensis]
MWDQIGRVCPEELQLNSKKIKQNSDRRKHSNYTSTLKELAQMLPIPLRTSCKRLTKKEMLLRVLRYIEHLQASIDTARSLLQVHSGEQKAGESEQMVTTALKSGRRETTPRVKKTKPLAVCKKPRKRRRTHKSEQQGVNKKVCKSLALETGKSPSQADEQQEENPSALGVWNLSGNHEESKDYANVFSACEAYEEPHRYTEVPTHSLMGQELVYYYSSCEEDEEEGPEASPWLSTWSPVGISHGDLQLCSPAIITQSNRCTDLGLSPSLFSSPARLLPTHILQGGQEEFSPVLFEDVCLSPQPGSFSQSLSGTLLRKSAFTLDHCYLSNSETGKSSSSPVSRENEIKSSWNKQFLQEEVHTARPECPLSSSDENSDSTWTPCKRTKPSRAARRKKKKKKKRKKKKRAGRRQRCRPVAREKGSNASPLQLKKKCVNGFIMFCRLNRKHFIRACPGMASTAATRELAQLWRVMTKQERHPYCLKARRFSRLNNRIVRDDFSSGEEEPEPPKPFHLLLAEKSLPGTENFGDFSLL